MVLLLSQNCKCGCSSLIFVKFCLKKLAFSPFLSEFYELDFSKDKILTNSNKKSTFVLVSGFFGCCIFKPLVILVCNTIHICTLLKLKCVSLN